MRIRARWNKHAREQSLEDIAGALNVICWKITTQVVLELENKGYKTHSNAHRLEIIGELLAFLLQIVDRLVYEQLEEEDRHRLVSTLAARMIDTYVGNQRDILGPGEYRKAFIELLNQRAEDYAELSFNNGQAGFDFLRYFGEQVEALMEEKHWVSQELISIVGPEAVKVVKKGLQDLFDRPTTHTG